MMKELRKVGYERRGEIWEGRATKGDQGKR